MKEQRTAALKALGELKGCFGRAEAHPDESLEDMVACNEEVVQAFANAPVPWSEPGKDPAF